jgi:hypothetical protein
MCGAIDPGHTCDEYLVLLAKSGMTLSGCGAGHGYPEVQSTQGGGLVTQVPPALVQRCRSSYLAKRHEINLVGYSRD